jgi:hypothetical protein
MGVIYYANPDPTFQPAMRLITNITNSFPATVTTSFNHDFITGTIVRIYVPSGFGMTQINNKTGTIIVTGATTFTIDIDTTRFDIFNITLPLDPYFQKIPLVVPIGEVNNTLLASVQNVLPL